MIPQESCPKIYFVKELPTLVICNALFYVKPDGTDRVKLYVSDNQGNYILVSTGTGAGVSSVTGTGVTGTASNPIVDILTFLSEQSGNALQISEEDGKLYLGSITAVHNELEEIQGGTEEERYHLTEAQWQYLTDIVTNDTIQSILDQIETLNPVFQNDIVVSLADGKTLGRYEDGDTIPAQGLTAEQVLNLIAQESIIPTVNLNSPTAVQFNQTAIANVLNFSFTINTLGATVETVSLEFRRNNTGTWSVLTDDENLTTFTHNLTDTAFNTQVFNYRYVVKDSTGAENTALFNITPQAYVAPTITLSAGTLTRDRGDIATPLTGTVTRNSSLVNISSYQVQVNVNGGGWNNLGSSQALSASGGAISFNHDDALLVDSNTIAYRVIIIDAFTTTTSGIQTVTLTYRNLLGFSSNSVLTISEILALTNSALSNSRARTITGVTAGVGLFTYYAYRAGAGDLTSVILDGAAPVLGAFTQLTEVTGTNSFGATVTYKIYKSNATQAFTDNSLAFS